CWKLQLMISSHQNYRLHCLTLILDFKNSSRVHVHNAQVCYICIHVPCWCVAPMNSSFTLVSSFSAL
uniref:Uncharacterized protein n=1 Tax=Macaca fascicularis TaxID=9541 RepID=A0A7N9D1N4_MACFA